MAPSPTVLPTLTLPDLLNHVLTTQSSIPTLLIICSDRPTFLSHLALAHKHSHSLTHLLAPTLHNLASTRHVQLAFCASVQALLAFLTAYGRHGERRGGERVVLVNVLALHKPTSFFSVQGLSRTFATALETGIRTGADVCLVECLEQRLGDDVAMSEGEDEHHGSATEQDPWDQHVSILNVSARKFGAAAGERPWAGRTVTAKRVAARWFRFQHHSSLPEHNDTDAR